MATTLVCFDDMNEMRDDRFMQVQKHCILICNSAPYSMPVQECQQYENKTVEQMATIFHEVCLFFVLNAGSLIAIAAKGSRLCDDKSPKV